MLRPPDQDSPLQQGDVIRDVPFVVLPRAINVKVQGVSGQKRIDSSSVASFEAAKQFSGGKPFLAAEMPLVLQAGMIVTQSCDLDFKDDVTLARVYPLSALVQTVRDAEQHAEPLVLYDTILRFVEGAEFNHLVYLRLHNGHFAADLLRLQSYNKDWKECFRNQRMATMTPEGLGYVQGRLTTFAGRFATTAGFWHASEEDAEMSKRVRADYRDVETAYRRLDEKKAGTKPGAV